MHTPSQIKIGGWGVCKIAPQIQFQFLVPVRRCKINNGGTMSGAPSLHIVFFTNIIRLKEI